MEQEVGILFRKATSAWVALYMLALLGLGEAAWSVAPVHVLTAHAFGAGWINGTLDAVDARLGVLLCVVVLGLALWRWRGAGMLPGLVLWLLFRVITARTWLASNGGIQLMDTMLLWSALLAPGERNDGLSAFVGRFAFWAARLQLVLVYAVTALHKADGTAWIDGTAVLLVAQDPDFDLGMLAASPRLCAAMTWAAFAFMALYPVAVWWSPARRVFMVLGTGFHLFTALFMDIPQMGLAFIACYTIWLQPEDARVMRAWLGRARTVLIG
jgi:hypothetical protein